VVRANVQILTKNSASPDEIQKWLDSLGLHTQQIERLATKLKAGNLALADTQTEVTKLWSAARLKLMQATGWKPMVEFEEGLARMWGWMATRSSETGSTASDM
jgi:nucleoside-diphosphate-sugar epimerase